LASLPLLSVVVSLEHQVARLGAGPRIDGDQIG
jgi:hypothetical protein